MKDSFTNQKWLFLIWHADLKNATLVPPITGRCDAISEDVRLTHVVCIHRPTKNSPISKKASRVNAHERNPTPQLLSPGCCVLLFCWLLWAQRKAHLSPLNETEAQPLKLLQHYVSHWPRCVQQRTQPLNHGSPETSLPTKLPIVRMRAPGGKTTIAWAPIGYGQKNYSSQ